MITSSEKDAWITSNFALNKHKKWIKGHEDLSNQISIQMNHLNKFYFASKTQLVPREQRATDKLLSAWEIMQDDQLAVAKEILQTGW